MIHFKHYSFDLWMTLIKSDPVFKMERALFFYKNFNGQKKSIGEIIFIFRQVDLMCNAINEKTGKNIDADEMYLMVISMMNDFDTAFEKIDLTWLYNEIEQLLFNHMPVIYCNQTISTLDTLRQKSNGSFNISSNTAFIKGSTLRKVLTQLSLAPFFDFQLYSDEIGRSKPGKEFFATMLAGIKNITANKDIALCDIVHIGDNYKADIEGATAVGITGVQINSNHSTILSLLN